MTTALPQIGNLTPTDLQTDIRILEKTPNILDAFLPASLRSTISAPTQKGLEDLESYTQNQKPTPEESVMLSRAFVSQARDGILALVSDGAEGKLGKLGEGIEAVRAEAETLERSLEGM
jgi:hypothetical protein